MARESHGGMSELPCSRGKVDGLQSRKRIGIVLCVVIGCSLGGLDGINLQMICSKCQQHFCYRCGSKLQAGNPYKHFSTPGGRCYSKLFDGWEEPMEGFILQVEGE